MERFRDTSYFITENGDVFNKKGRKLKPYKTPSGYFQIKLGSKYISLVHRLVAEVYCEGYDSKLEVNHIDGNKLNNHFSNLEWCTGSHNIQHSYDIKLHLPVDSNLCWTRSLTEEQVLEIRRLAKTTTLTLKELADQFNVHPISIKRVINRQTWKQI